MKRPLRWCGTFKIFLMDGTPVPHETMPDDDGGCTPEGLSMALRQSASVQMAAACHVLCTPLPCSTRAGTLTLP
jgi:hypothetical protein